MTPSRPIELWLVGRIGRPVGLRGECTLIPESQNPDDLAHFVGGAVRLAARGSDASAAPAAVWESLRWQGERAVITLGGVADRDAAAALTHSEIWVETGDLGEPGEGRWWVSDLVGCEVEQIAREQQSARSVGQVAGVFEGGAQDLLEVERDGGKVRFQVPMIEPFLIEVDIAAKRIRVDLPEGLAEG